MVLVSRCTAIHYSSIPFCSIHFLTSWFRRQDLQKRSAIIVQQHMRNHSHVVTFLSGHLLRLFSLKSLQFLSWLMDMSITWHPRIQHHTHESPNGSWSWIIWEHPHVFKLLPSSHVTKLKFYIHLLFSSTSVSVEQQCKKFSRTSKCFVARI